MPSDPSSHSGRSFAQVVMTLEDDRDHEIARLKRDCAVLVDALVMIAYGERMAGGAALAQRDIMVARQALGMVGIQAPLEP